MTLRVGIETTFGVLRIDAIFDMTTLLDFSLKVLIVLANRLAGRSTLQISDGCPRCDH